MASEWKEVRLSELIEVTHGFAFPGDEILDSPSSDILVTPGNFAIGGGFKGEKFKYFHGKVPEEYVLRAGEIVVTMTDLSKQGDTLGYSAIIPEMKKARFLHNQRVGKVIITDRNEVDPHFMYYLLRSREYRHEILASATGTSIKHTAPSRILAYKTRIPDISEQKAIAQKLKALDDKIALNREMNETLEAMARALFKSWFVDFDPVRAKAEGRNPGLPASLAALFPDSFEDTELNEIPKGWSVRNLANLASLNPESWSRQTRPESIRYVDLSNVKWGRIEEPTAYSSADAPSRAQRVLNPGDTIVGTVRPGNSSYALVAEAGLTGSTGFAVLRPMVRCNTEFVYLAATSPETIDHLAHLADGGAYPAVRPEVVASQMVACPDHEVLVAFSALAAPLLTRMAQNEQQSSGLSAVRDVLLPKLISGQIRLSSSPGED